MMDLDNDKKKEKEKEVMHVPQCNCNFKSLMRKTIHVFHLEKNEDTCNIAKKWLKMTMLPHNSEQYYNNLLKVSFEKEVLIHSNRQIDLDIPRTFPECPYFSKGDGYAILQRVLYGLTRYNPALGYVQGMNYIAACLLFHCKESDAFWLLLRLVYDYNLVQNYLPRLPGLEKHSHVLEFLLIEHLPELYEHLTRNGVIVQMFATEWCLTLFTSLLSLENSCFFLTKFFKHRWVFFYKFVIEILDRLKDKLLLTDSTMRILDMLKPLRANNAKASNEFLRSLEINERLTWQKVVRIANEREINEEVVRCLDENFEAFAQLENEV